MGRRRMVNPMGKQTFTIFLLYDIHACFRGIFCIVFRVHIYN